MAALNNISRTVVQFVRDEEGASAVEYGLLASLIAAAIIIALQTLGGKLTSTFGTVSAQLK